MTADNKIASRIPLLSKEESLARGQAQGIDDYIAQLNLFRVLLHFPEIAKELNNSIIALVSSDSVLSHRLRELIIMRVAWVTQSEYEWTQHWQVCLMFDISEDEIVAVKDWQQSDCFDGTDKIVLKATDDVLNHGSIQQATWDKLSQLIPDPAAQITVVASIGNWQMFSQIMQSLTIPLEEGAMVWPPNGIGPTGSKQSTSNRSSDL